VPSKDIQAGRAKLIWWPAHRMGNRREGLARYASATGQPWAIAEGDLRGHI